jgi:hypothetical protein
VSRKLVLGSIAATAAFVAVGVWRGTRWWRTWGVRPADSAAVLPGDELIAGAVASDTRSVSIAAPAQAVWPWLVQMGYGRAGWYSYDALDMRGKSADRLLPEHAVLAVGDVVPTDPSGGFAVKVLEPERALVLYVDAAMVAERKQAGSDAAGEAVPAGLAASGKLLDTATPPDFAVSWSFSLHEEDGATRLVERVRFRAGDASGASRVLGPVLGFGVFVMMQRQMVGIRDRAEHLPRG